MLPMRDMMRFELNNPLAFANIADDSWGSIYRRSIAIETNGQFPPDEEYGSLTDEEKNTGVSPQRATN